MTRAGARAGRDVHPLARVVHAVLFRAATSCAAGRSGGWRASRRPRCSSAAIRSSRSRPRRRRLRPAAQARYLQRALLWCKPDGTRRAPSTARCTWCRSASTCRSSRCCSSPGRSSERSPTSPRSPPAPMPVLLPVGSHMASTAICYEVIYPNLIRRFVLDGSELLTTITNDAWYGRSSAAVSALGPGVDARDRAGTLSGAGGQHRHQRLRRSVRPLMAKIGAVRDAPSSSRICGSSTDRTIYSRIGDLVPGSARGTDRRWLVDASDGLHGIGSHCTEQRYSVGCPALIQP